MTKTALIPAAALALALSACSGGGEAPRQSSEEASEEASEKAPSSEAAAPEATSEAVATAAGTIPEVLRGRWGLVPADCTSTKGDAKGLMTVSADKLTFYESVAELGQVKAAEADRVAASYAFSGEGQTWLLDVALSSPDGGKTLVRRDSGPDAMPGPLTYTKCPS
ncbi:hypothetical protein SAMN05518801_10140 [Novosphingobium sp. CF614]|uniref:hypothetical protein n=1 Tax=Novosphingobium sp. CF614 TaxID=1884364 RepID=UPI0008E1ACED|nr:hypothetical protein [Novosphingobium sp. CF614]SFF73189.1 hypothetical protein SAMN05518801_10140 [Novosphingobium sp. CF614]